MKSAENPLLLKHDLESCPLREMKSRCSVVIGQTMEDFALAGKRLFVINRSEVGDKARALVAHC